MVDRLDFCLRDFSQGTGSELEWFPVAAHMENLDALIFDRGRTVLHMESIEFRESSVRCVTRRYMIAVPKLGAYGQWGAPCSMASSPEENRACWILVKKWVISAYLG